MLVAQREYYYSALNAIILTNNSVKNNHFGLILKLVNNCEYYYSALNKLIVLLATEPLGTLT